MAMVNQSDRSRSNVLHHCCPLGLHEIPYYLLNCSQLSSGLIHTQNPVDDKPLFESIQHINHADRVDETSEIPLNQFKCFELLLTIGLENNKLNSNIEIKNNHCFTTFTSAVIQNDVKIANVLVHEPGSQVDVLTRSKKARLMITVETNYDEIATSLNSGARYDMHQFVNSAKTQAKGDVLKLVQIVDKKHPIIHYNLKPMNSSSIIIYKSFCSFASCIDVITLFV